MNNLERAEELELEAQTQYWAELNASLTRLEKCPDFNRVVLEGYFKDRALNDVSLLGNSQIIDAGKRPGVIENLVAISKLQDFFLTVKSVGTVMVDEDCSVDDEMELGE